MVSAARRHLTERYAAGVDRLLWDTEKRVLSDLDAIRAVLAARWSGQAEALDVAAALVLIQAARLELDRLEHDVFLIAHTAGMSAEALAAVLDLPDGQAAIARQRWLETRHALPYAKTSPPPAGRRVAPARHDPAKAVARQGRRAQQAAQRAAGAGRRRDELRRAAEHDQAARGYDAEQASAHASEARILAAESAERAALALLQAAAVLEQHAAQCLERAEADPGRRPELRRRAQQLYQTAAENRHLAERCRDTSTPPHEHW